MDVKKTKNKNDFVEKTGTSAKATFDDVLKELGQFGSYQRKTYFLLFLVKMFSSFDYC